MGEFESTGGVLPRVKLHHVVESDDRRIVPFAPRGSAPRQEVCPICKGAGFLRVDVQYGHPNFGKPIACKCKVAARKTRLQVELMELSGITSLKRFKDATFDNFKLNVSDVSHAFRQAKRFAEMPDGRWLALTGPAGCGKTHLAVATAKEWIEAGYTVLVITVPDLLDKLRSTFSADTEQSFDEMFTRMRNVDCLVLDDLAVQQTTDWAKEKLFQLINHRYNECLPTFFTSNDIHLMSLDTRIRSRLCDKSLSTVVKMENACDYRMPDAEDEEL